METTGQTLYQMPNFCHYWRNSPSSFFSTSLLIEDLMAGIDQLAAQPTKLTAGKGNKMK